MTLNYFKKTAYLSNQKWWIIKLQMSNLIIFFAQKIVFPLVINIKSYNGN